MPSNNRNLQDASLALSVSVPSAGNNSTSTASIDLAQVAPFPLTEQIDFLVSLPAQATLADTKTVTATVYDSADGSSFTALAGVGTLVQTGAGGVGAAATSLRLKLAPGVRRYVALNVATAGTSGTVSGSASLTPLF